MSTLKINPFFIFPIIGLTIALFGIAKLISPSDQLAKSQLAIDKMHSDNVIKKQELQAELDQLKAIKNPTKHNIWHIKHLEKSVAHLSKFESKKYKPKKAFSYFHLKTLSTIAVIVIVASIYIWNHLRNNALYNPRAGLKQNSNRLYPQDDSVAQKTHWQPMASGASNFKMQDIFIDNNSLFVKPSFEVKLFYSAFFITGLIPVLIDYVFAWKELESIFNPFISAYGLFILIGLTLGWIFNRNKVEFNKTTLLIIKTDQTIPLQEAYALQVISSISGGHGHGVFKNNELNIILKNGDRVNILNHGNILAFEDQELKISNFLNIPVWQA